MNVHTADTTGVCLGAVRVLGSLHSDKTLETIAEHLLKFGISFENDIVAIICEGARVNVKAGEKSLTEIQIWHAHGIHLAIADILYTADKTDNNVTDNIEYDEISSSSYEETSESETEMDTVKDSSNYEISEN
jgi:hypothetical protein